MGSHHSIELAAGRKFTLEKSTWDSVALERLRASTDLAGNADLAALLLTSGTATLVLIKGELSITRAKIEVGKAVLCVRAPWHVGKFYATPAGHHPETQSGRQRARQGTAAILGRGGGCNPATH